MTATAIAALLLLPSICIVIWRIFHRQAYPSPPGPRGLPFIGNLFDWPQGYDWLYWVKHKELYGPISRAHVLGRDVIIINDANIAMDLLDKRSSTYSDRPQMIFTRELAGWKDMLAVVEYGDNFRTQRKYLHQVFGTQKAVSKFYSLQDIDAKRCILRLIREPGDLEHQIRLTIGSTILKATYGYSVGSGSDPLINLANTADRAFVASIQNAWAVDTLPFLRWLPEWLPGVGFQRIGKAWRQTTDNLMDIPMDFVRERMANGNAYPSFVKSLLETTSSAYDEHVIKMAAGSLYAGGSDTTVSALLSYFLVVTMFPHIQAKVQEELDEVIGLDRLPTHQDREDLPYLNAVLKELLRWGTVVPMGIPHAASKDDVYMGYFIRKGSLVWPNIWHFLHDPERYADPESFLPERHLYIDGKEPEPDPRLFCFGFGRRICPGKEVADSSAFILIALAGAVLNISRTRDASGNEIIPEKRMTGGGVSHPKPFPCVITARSAKTEALIEAANEDQPMEASNAVYLPKYIQEQYC